MSRIICECCGAEIDTETGETHFVKGSNAHSIDVLQREKTQLQYDLKSMKEQYDIVLEKLNDLKEGKTDNGTEGNDTGRGVQFPFEQ